MPMHDSSDSSSSSALPSPIIDSAVAHISTPPVRFHIRPAVAADLPRLTAVELSAAARFRSIPALAFLADNPPLQQCFLSDLILKHAWGARLFIACPSSSPSSPILAFLGAFIVDSTLFIAELSVVSTAQAQGIGTALLAAVEAEAQALMLDGVSLTTYKKVPFNGPWYAKRGFEFVSPDQVGPSLVEWLAKEIRQGLSDTGWERGIMVKWLRKNKMVHLST